MFREIYEFSVFPSRAIESLSLDQRHFRVLPAATVDLCQIRFEPIPASHLTPFI